MTDIRKEDIYKLSDDLMKSAKRGLEEDGRVFPVAYVLCSKMEVGPWLRKTLLDGDTGEMVTEDQIGLPGKDNLLLAVPCFYDDVNMLVHMLTYLSMHPDKTEEAFNLLRASAPQIGVKDPERKIVDSFKKNWDCEEKDIVANFLRKVCEETKAHTIVKIDEVYASIIERKEGMSAKDARNSLPKDLKDAPGRTEGIQVATETKTFRRFSMQPFSRKSEDETAPGYKEIIWSELMNTEDTVEKQLFTGRFANLIMPRPTEDLYTKKSGPLQ